MVYKCSTCGAKYGFPRKCFDCDGVDSIVNESAETIKILNKEVNCQKDEIERLREIYHEQKCEIIILRDKLNKLASRMGIQSRVWSKYNGI